MLRIIGTALLAGFTAAGFSFGAARAFGANAGIAAPVSGVLLAAIAGGLMLRQRRSQQ